MSSKYLGGKLASELSIALFKVILAVGTVTISQLEASLGLNSKNDKIKLYRRLAYYKKRGDIIGNAKQGFSLTTSGIEALNALEFSNLKQTQKWDGKWRIISFDIPESKREARDAVRRLIKELGCHQLQRSVWIHPLPCLDRFQKIRAAYGITNHLVLLETAWIDRHEELKRQFLKQYPKL